MNLKNLCFLSLTVIGLNACGKLNNAVDSTIGMSSKMDTMVNGVAQTNNGVNETVAGMDKTNNAIHLQTLGTALDDILKSDNTKYISFGSSTPTSMMVPGKIFAEEATQEEIAELTYTLTLEINLAQPDTSLMDPTTGDYPAAVKNQADSDKWIKFNALQVIAGLTPQATIDDMVNQQIIQGGRYEDAAYSVLLLRHLFIQTYLLDFTLLTEKMDDFGKFDEALTDIGNLKTIEKYPFASKVQLTFSGFFDVDKLGYLNKTWTLENFTTGKTYDVSKDYYPQLKTMLSQLSPTIKAATDGITTARLNKLKADIDAGIAGN